MADHSFDAPHTPTSGSDDDQPAFGHGSAPESDHEAETVEEAAPRRKPGGYGSRIEQILYENPDLPIMITDAGKSLESGGRYIVYTIRTGVRPFRYVRPLPWTDEPPDAEPRSAPPVLRVCLAP